MFVEICDRRRNISGKVTFRTLGGKECPVKGAKVFLLIKDRVEGLESFCPGFLLKEEGEIHSLNVDDSFYEEIPRNPIYYTRTYTKDDGSFKFEEFLDPACKHNYAIIVVFQSPDYFGPNLTYCNCEKTFFVRKDINKTTFPCSPTHSEVDIYIGKKGDKKYDPSLKMPKDFSCIRGNHYIMGSPPNGVDMAQIWCHIMESYELFKDLHCGSEGALKPMKLKICAFSKEFDNSVDEGRGAFYYNGEIHIGPLDSHQGDNDEPMNREWHEFGHYLHDCLYGIPNRAPGDINHFGLANSNSADSFLEGFAEATSLFILRQIKLKGTCCLDAPLPRNGIYEWEGGMSDLENGRFKSDTAVYGYLDSHGNFHRVNRSNIKCVGGELKDAAGHKIIMAASKEELGVAGLLLDLLDSGSWYDEIKNNVVIHGRDDDGFSFSNWRDFFCLLKEKKIQNIKELYDALREKFKDNKSALEKIDKIFIEHGFFQDKDFDGVRDPGEKVGVTYRCKTEYYYKNSGWDHKTLTKIEERKDFPLIPQANILVHLLDKNGNPIESGTLIVEVLSFDGRVNFSYKREAKDGEPFYIFITPNGDEILRIHMKDSKEKPLIVTEDELWTSVMNNNEYVKEHTFKMVEEESLPEIKLLVDSLDFGSLLEGEKKSQLVYFVNSGGGILNVSFTTSKSWIKVEPQEFEGNAGFIKVTVDTEGLSGGMNRGKIIVSGNGGEREIDVSVSVVPKVKKTVIELFIGSTTAYINGEVYTLDASPYIKPPGRTMVPLRFISEGLGATVDYWPKTGKVKEVYIYFKGKKITL
ncbi:MAG: hypothetical protein DRI22_03695, partial [Caldiserica bacterium]